MTSSGSSCPSVKLWRGVCNPSIANCDSGTNPSTSSTSETTMPRSRIREIVPRTSTPTAYCSAKRGQGFSKASLWLSEMRRRLMSISETTTGITSPFLNISLAWRMRLVQDISEMCTSPSMLSSIAMKAPKLVRLHTVPSILVPGGYLASRVSHGSSSVCFMPSEIFWFSLSILSTFTSTMSPMLTSLEGWRTC